MERQLVILFGRAGAGENFGARLLASEFGYYLYEADQDLTPEMIDVINIKRQFTAKIRDEHLEIVKIKLIELLAMKAKVVLTQGLFKNKHRFNLSKEFLFASFIWVDVN